MVNKNKCCNQEWKWVAEVESAGFDQYPTVGTDPCGNIVVGGLSRHRAHFYDTDKEGNSSEKSTMSTKFSKGGQLFIGKMDPCGKWKWVTTVNAKRGSGIGGPGSINKAYLTVDQCGDIIVSIVLPDRMGAEFLDVGSSEPTILASSHRQRQIVVAKMSSSGCWRWIRYIRADENEDIELDGSSCPISIGPDGSIVVGGDAEDRITPKFYSASKSGKIDKEPSLIGTTSKNHQTFLAKLSKDGCWLWTAAAFSTSSTDDSPSVVVDKNGDVFFAADGSENTQPEFYSANSYGNTQHKSSLVGIRSRRSQIYLGKLNGYTGRWLWTASITSSGSNGTFDPCLNLDSCGNLIVAADGFSESRPLFHNANNFGNTEGRVSMIGRKSEAIVVAKINTCGEWIWNASAGSRNDFENVSIATDSCDNTYVAFMDIHFNNSYSTRLYDASFDGTVSESPSLIRKDGLNFEITVGKINKYGRWEAVFAVDSFKFEVEPEITVDKCDNVILVGASIFPFRSRHIPEEVEELLRPKFYNCKGNSVAEKPAVLARPTLYPQLFVAKIGQK